MSLAGLLEATVGATIGRRLVVRIWAHGVLLFAGVIATVLIGRWMMSEIDDASTVRARPYLAVSAAERVLAHRQDPAALAHELRRARAATSLHLSVFDAAGAPLTAAATATSATTARAPASTIAPPLSAPTAAERAALTTTGPLPRWAHRRMVVGAFAGGQLAAVVVLQAPRPPSVPWHVVVFLSSALVLAFVFVAAPLAYSIAGPIARLGRLARELGAGNLAVRAHSRRHDEIGALARSFDTMAGQIQNLRAAERQLLGDVSHELRTPLSRMRVVLELADTADLARVRRYLAEITADLGELEQLLDDIITSVRLDPAAGRWDEARPPLRKTRLPVHELVAAAAERFRARWPGRTLTVHRDDAEATTTIDDPAAATAGLELDGDPAMLRRVLDNLLDNARKYSGEDAPIELRVEQLPAAAGGEPRRVRITVIDRGAGIAAADQPRVFSPFFRADRSRARSSGGVGLGLALARRIVLAHGGAMGFESELDRGSRFWLTLDVRRAS